MRFIVFVVLLFSVAVVGQTISPRPPKTPTEAWERVNAKAENERGKSAQKYSLLFKLEQWHGEELLRLGQLYSLAEQHQSAQRALTSYLAEPKILNAIEARRLLVKALIAQEQYGVALPLADALLAESDYDRETLVQVQELIQSLAAIHSKDGKAIFEKTLPGLFRLAADEIKKNTKFGSTMAGMMLVDMLQAVRAYREAGDLSESEDLVNIFVAAFNATPLATDDKVTKLVDTALRQARLVGAKAPAVEGVEYLQMPKSSLDELRGKVVLLDFFAHWCKPCIEEFPNLNALKDKYRPRGIEVLGVTTYYGFVGNRQDVKPADELLALKSLRTESNVNFGFIVSPYEEKGQYGVAASAYEVAMLPTTALIDREGKLRYLRTAATMAELERLIQLLLSEPVAKQQSKFAEQRMRVRRVLQKSAAYKACS